MPKEALDYFAAKKLQPGFSYLDVWKQEHTYAFTVAKLMEKDLLADVRRSVEKALKEGLTFDQWSSEIESVFDDSGWSAYGDEAQKPSRLKTIYNTNMRVARSAGQWERIERTKKTQPYLQYMLGPSEKHRQEHVDWAEAPTILPVDDPFWDDHMPPNGWGCKCYVIPLSARAADRAGGETDSPDDGSTYEWKNPATGETEEIPVGIDPGWNYNPGKDREDQLQAAEEE